MNCPACDGAKSRVLKTTHGIVNGDAVIIRSRICLHGGCCFRWRSYECYEAPTGEKTEEKLRRIVEILNE